MSRVARRVVLVLVLGVLVGGGLSLARPVPAVACSCAQSPSPAADLARAEAVFAGRLVEISEPLVQGSSTAPVRLRFAVDRVYKGDVGREVVVVTAASSASCGLGIDQLGAYVIFASGAGTQFSSGACRGSDVGPAPAALGAGYAPTDAVAPTTAERRTGRILIPIAALVVAAGAVLLVRRLRLLRRSDTGAQGE